LLICEECYYGPAAASFSTQPVRDNVHLLANKTMNDNYVNIVGEGSVGDAAFTGIHQWVQSENCYREADPPEKTIDGGNNNPVNYNIINYDDADLYDILNSCSNILSSNASATNTRNLDKKNNSPSTQENLNTGFRVSDHVKGELSGIPKYTANAGGSKNGPCNEDSGTFSRNSSIYDSRVENGSNLNQNYGSATGYSDTSRETNEAKRKRLKPCENPRPRPKDRQMIQDRVKELREIVPNGEKYSIDALLERTIKHMLFLQSIVKHADELTKDNVGATWAYEVRSQSTVCPIVVEDLNQPRQMLIEMLCEERGIFLEIADIIRGLGLTILKGLIETRDDKIWAHFIVEANRNMTKIEVFLSLLHLCENGVPKPNNVNNENIAVGLS
ncbi:hypothetical protein MIMGU_mgv1a020569mg, partial [Erythranthe guttata]